ncbi:MAG: tail fiber domain-containing protein [Phycisphaerae bacterium]
MARHTACRGKFVVARLAGALMLAGCGAQLPESFSPQLARPASQPAAAPDDEPAAMFSISGRIRVSHAERDAESALQLEASSTQARVRFVRQLGRASAAAVKLLFDHTTTECVGRLGVDRPPRTCALEVSGEALKATPGGWLAPSDARIKVDVRTIDHALETLDRVRLVSFRYDDACRAANPAVADRRYLDVLAQEFRDVFPEWVRASNELLPGGERLLLVDTYPLVIYSAAAVQELHRQVRHQADEIAALRGETAVLRARIAQMEARLDAETIER